MRCAMTKLLVNINFQIRNHDFHFRNRTPWSSSLESITILVLSTRHFCHNLLATLFFFTRLVSLRVVHEL